MTNKVDLLELVIRYHALSNNRLITKIQQEYKDMSFKEITKFLKEHYMENRNVRLTTIWSIENIIEENILAHINKSNEILILENSYRTVKSRFYKLIKSEEVFKSIIKNRDYKNINDMRAFAAICEGDIETYKIFSGNSDKILAYALLRVLAISNEYNEDSNQEKTNEILELAINVLKTIYDVENDEELSVREIMKYNFKEKDYLLDEYKKIAIKGEVLFAPGIFEILENYFKSNDGLEEYEVIKKNFENAFLENSKDEVENEEVNNENDSKDVELENENSNEKEECESTVSEESYEMESIEINIDEIGIETKEEVLSNEDVESNDISSDEAKKEIQIKLKEIETLMNKIETTNDNNEDAQNQLKEIEELKNENTRLRNEVDILRKRISEVSLKDFIQKVGGRECGYQLSELYMLSEGIMEDDGNTQGRLINLFGILEGYFLEAYIGHHKINDEFEIDRKTLSQNYLLEMPLRGEDEVVKVKLIKNGWRYNSEMIVPPLVRQLF